MFVVCSYEKIKTQKSTEKDLLHKKQVFCLVRPVRFERMAFRVGDIFKKKNAICVFEFL